MKTLHKTVSVNVSKFMDKVIIKETISHRELKDAISIYRIEKGGAPTDWEKLDSMMNTCIKYRRILIDKGWTSQELNELCEEADNAVIALRDEINELEEVVIREVTSSGKVRVSKYALKDAA